MATLSSQTHCVVDWQNDGDSVVQLCVLHLLYTSVRVKDSDERRVFTPGNGVHTAPHLGGVRERVEERVMVCIHYMY